MTTEPKVFSRAEVANELESGRWKKGKSAMLDSNGGYCCLGVMARMAGVATDDECKGLGVPSSWVAELNPEDRRADLLIAFAAVFPWCPVGTGNLTFENDANQTFDGVIRLLRSDEPLTGAPAVNFVGGP